MKVKENMLVFSDLKNISYDQMQNEDLGKLFKDNLQHSRKLRPDTIIKYQMDKLDRDFADVKDLLQDHRDQFQTTVPSKIMDNNLRLKRGDYENFRNVHLQKKRQLELKIIKENHE